MRNWALRSGVVSMTTNPAIENDLSVPLCVDLDGTLIASDLLWESFCAMLRSQPASLAMIPFWLMRGRAALKHEIASRGNVDPTVLPYRAEVLSLIASERDLGRKVVLATAADGQLAHAVAEHLGIFDEVIASDGENNLKGSAKRLALEARFGAMGFDYVGDSAADLSVWKSARRAYVVMTHPRVISEAERERPIHRVGAPAGGFALGLFKALRPHQWAKNSLLLVPLITSHRLLEPWLLLQILIALATFNLTASAVYIVNDLLDLQADRRHRTKRNRPFASGKVPIPVGGAAAVALLVLGVAGSLLLPATFTGLLLLYLAVTTAYSWILKRKPMADVVCLAGLYSLRIFAGGAAVGVSISPWLIAFSMFFFLSLAFAKRYTEIEALPTADAHVANRGYRAPDLELIRAMGPACGLLSVLVFCLYINSPDIRLLYRRPELLWLSCPFLLYWIGRLWLFAGRGALNDDPVIFAIHDGESYLTGAAMGLILLLSV